MCVNNSGGAATVVAQLWNQINTKEQIMWGICSREGRSMQYYKNQHISNVMSNVFQPTSCASCASPPPQHLSGSSEKTRLFLLKCSIFAHLTGPILKPTLTSWHLTRNRSCFLFIIILLFDLRCFFFHFFYVVFHFHSLLYSTLFQLQRLVCFLNKAA